ncbi:MAG: hypothetical protein EOP50_08870, partial [Sphingobacteriales bacterium]
AGAVFSISYVGNGHSGGLAPADAGTYTANAVVTLLGNSGNLVKTGYTFMSWNSSADGSGTSYSPATTMSMPSANLTLYARWVAGYAVIYDGNGAASGSAPLDVQAPYLNGLSVTTLGNTGTFKRAGYTFANWNTSDDGSGTAYAPGASFTMPSAIVTLYAQWTPSASYTVTYNGNTQDTGTVPTDANTYWQDGSVPVAGNTGSLAKAGFTFAGWNMASAGSGVQNAVDESFFMPGSAVTLYARWVPTGQFSVYYNGNGHSGGTVPVDGASPYVASAPVTVIGNTGSLVRGTDTFLGWNTSANGTGTNYAGGETFNVSAHTVLYARWTPNYSVNFDANGGTGVMAAKSISQGTSAKLPTNAFTRTNYVFAGWATTPTGPMIYNDQQSYLMGSANSTLYAKWMATSSLLVSYNFNNQNAQDTSGNGANGTGHNVLYVPDGPGNYSVQTNGTSSYVELPQNIVMNSPNMTIMMRFKARPGQHGSLFGYQGGPVNSSPMQHVPMIVVRSDGRLRGELWTTSNQALEVVSATAVNDGQWHTVYFSSDGSRIKLFLDGVLIGSASSSVNHLTMTYNQIGTSRASGRTLMPNAAPLSNNWYYFNGLIDDFYFYNTAL